MNIPNVNSSTKMLLMTSVSPNSDTRTAISYISWKLTIMISPADKQQFPKPFIIIFSCFKWFCFSCFHGCKWIKDEVIQYEHCPFAQITFPLVKINQIYDRIPNILGEINEIMIQKLVYIYRRVNVPIEKSPAKYWPDNIEIFFPLLPVKLQRAVFFPMTVGGWCIMIF